MKKHPNSKSSNSINNASAKIPLNKNHQYHTNALYRLVRSNSRSSNPAMNKLAQMVDYQLPLCSGKDTAAGTLVSNTISVENKENINTENLLLTTSLCGNAQSGKNSLPRIAQSDQEAPRIIPTQKSLDKIFNRSTNDISQFQLAAATNKSALSLQLQ